VKLAVLIESSTPFKQQAGYVVRAIAFILVTFEGT